MGTTACGGKGSKGRAATGDRPIGAARCSPEESTKGRMPDPPNTPPSSTALVTPFEHLRRALMSAQSTLHTARPRGSAAQASASSKISLSPCG